MKTLTVTKLRGDYEQVTVHAIRSNELVTVIVEFCNKDGMKSDAAVCHCDLHTECPYKEEPEVCIAKITIALLESVFIQFKPKHKGFQDVYAYWTTQFTVDDFEDGVWKEV